MRLSDAIAAMIEQMLSETDGIVEIQRNELANRLGCVPSQINYVITSRFTPEQGYIVESRRGGGGYIRITRVKFDRGQTLMHIINSIGTKLDGKTASVFLRNLYDEGLVGDEAANLMRAALSDMAYRIVPQEFRDSIRASIFKQMLAALLR